MGTPLLRASLLTAIAAVSALAAQPERICAYVPSDTPSTGTCNVFPFSNGAFTYQVLVPESQLGCPGRITSLAFAACGTNSRTFTNIRVSMSSNGPATLDATFANNLGPDTAEVLNQASLTWDRVADVWSALPLDCGFDYLGGNLVIEIRIDDSTGGFSGCHRDSTIERAYDPGSGSATVATAQDTAALKMQVCFGLYYHVPDNTPTTGTCNVFPWGQASFTYQQLLTANDLGNRCGFIRKIGFAACNTGSRTFTNLDIRMAHKVAPSLDPTFATNLESDDTSVLSGAPTYTYTANEWANVELDNGFFYNGLDNLVIEIRVDGGTGTSFHRTNNRPRAFATGSGATTGTVDMAALKIRVCVDCRVNIIITPFAEGCGPVGSGLGIGASVATRGVLGKVWDLLMRFGPPGPNPGGFVIGTTNRTPYPIPLAFLGAPGCFLRNDIIAVVPTVFPSGGGGFSAPAPIGTPYDLNLCGLRLYFQGFAIWPGINGLGLATSNQLIVCFGVAQ